MSGTTVLSFTVVTDHEKDNGFNLRRPNLRNLVRFSNICTLTIIYVCILYINEIHFDVGNINAVVSVGDKLNSSKRD